MIKLTDEELAENDIVLVIPFSAGWPRQVGDLLNAYIGYERGGKYIYKVPGYIARQVEKIYASKEQQPELKLV